MIIIEKELSRFRLRTTESEKPDGSWDASSYKAKKATSTHYAWVKVTLSSALLVTMSIVNPVISFVNIVIILKSGICFLCILYNPFLIA